MRRLTRLIWTSSLLLAASAAQAQPPAEEEEEAPPAEEPVEPAPEEPVETAPEDEAWAEEEEPRLRPPETDELRLGADEAQEAIDAEEEAAEEAAEDDELPSPAEAQDRLDEGAEEASDVTTPSWTTPQTVVDLHGYMRFRGEFQDNFFMNRQLAGYGPETGLQDARNVILPWAVWLPYEDGITPEGGCNGVPGTPCDQHALAYATMRLRLEPTIHLSDDVRVRMQLDAFDNMVLGSTPNSFAVGPAVAGEGFNPYYRYERTVFAPLDTLSTTMEPPTFGYNSLEDSIKVRRAWAEVRNRGLGELRFGRMGDHWGLGLLANGGTGIDADYQTDVDRIMLSTRLAGIYFFGAWDFAAEGLLYNEPADIGGLAFDRSRVDDVDQYVVGAAYRMTQEEQTAALQRGDAVFNVGGRFAYRSQNLTSSGTSNPFGLCVICDENGDLLFPDAVDINGDPANRNTGREGVDPIFVRRGADIFIPDVWMQFMYEKLRLELEAVFVYGTIDNLSNTQFVSPDDGPAATLLQFGFAFEGEYRLLNDQLGIYFASGFASGDQDVEGLSRMSGLQRQLPGPDGTADRTYSTFFFHPNYRVDLIFWRNVMRQVGGAYYFRPGLSYDFIRNSFGQLLGARADVVWSRASEPIQTWGNADDLGVEIDVSVYYRSEDGPDILDGFYAQAQWGIFFPLDGLGYLPGTMDAPSLGNAQTFRLLLGVMY